MWPASVFIMDVTKSSSTRIGEELSSYLIQLEEMIKTWYGNTIHVQVKHRSGDELILLAEGYSSAFITAFYISRIWKYDNNAPYFGLSFGSIEKEVATVDIDKWIHPLVKQARNANEHLKKQKDRESFCFQTNEPASEFEVLMNGMVRLQHVLSMQQTEIQRLVGALYLVYGKQNIVAGFLGRTAPTVYSHYKKGHSEQILGSFHDIVSVLNSLQAKNFMNTDNSKAKTFEENIRNNIKGQVQSIFDIQDLR